MQEQGQSGTRFLRRDVLGGRSLLHRPPWTNEASIRTDCTSCGHCLKACPEAILVSGPAGTPIVDFNFGACTFCGACVGACDENVFADVIQAPWSLAAEVGPRCLLKAGISCQSCTDACDEDALRFDLAVRPAGAIRLDLDKCTGCGACVAVCPVDAISMKHGSEAAA